jgi:hypothetical protein
MMPPLHAPNEARPDEQVHETAVTPASPADQVAFVEVDPGLVMTSCANCGAQMIDRKCKLICSCGYFLSCSDYY